VLPLKKHNYLGLVLGGVDKNAINYVVFWSLALSFADVKND
jgi:hypothetical protein